MVFLVNQGKTWKQERAGGFLWSPKLNSAGHENAGYALMQSVHKGDYILHNKGGMIAAIGVAKGNCYDAIQPEEVRENSGSYNWDDKGYRVDVEYYDFSTPVPTSQFVPWVKLHHHKDSCFQVDGRLKLRYLCEMAEEDAKYVVEEILKQEQDAVVKTMLYDALASLALGEDTYDDADDEAIEALFDENSGSEKHYSGKLKNPQAMTTSGGSSKAKPKRDPQIAANALVNANYKCEYDPEDKLFLRKKSGKPYTEPHHLIPISKYKNFAYSVDVEENIVSLCSHCHNLIHYGRDKDKEIVLRKIYNERIDQLKDAGLFLTFEQLMRYYK